MRIIFVRHGHPNYVDDCLTPLGHKHAEAAALRLKDEGVAEIYSSTCGRAFETAQHLADTLDLTVVPCDFMREISWGSVDGEPIDFNGHPWDTADRMVAEGASLLEPDWASKPPFDRNILVQCAETIAAATDAWLHTLGYDREGLYYRCNGGSDKTIAVFYHGGASAAMLSHLFNLAFPFVCTTMGPDYTGITVVSLPCQSGSLVTPRFELMNDARHIQGLRIANIYDN